MRALDFVRKEIHDTEMRRARKRGDPDSWWLADMIQTLKVIESLIVQDELDRERMPEVEKEHEQKTDH